MCSTLKRVIMITLKICKKKYFHGVPVIFERLYLALSLDLFGKCLRRMFKVLIDNTNLKQLKIYSFNEIICSRDPLTKLGMTNSETNSDNFVK